MNSSDSCGSSSPAALESSSLLGTNSSRSNSPADSDTSTISSPDGSLTEIFVSEAGVISLSGRVCSVCLFQNTLTLNEALARNYFSNNNDLDLSNLQNLQAIHAFKCLQQQPPNLLSSLLHTACSHNTSQQVGQFFEIRAVFAAPSCVRTLPLYRMAVRHKILFGISVFVCVFLVNCLVFLKKGGSLSNWTNEIDCFIKNILFHWSILTDWAIFLQNNEFY